MQNTVSNKIIFNQSFSEDDLQKGIYIVVLHATRIPPHIGIAVGNKYHSLTIKGQEINLSIEALIKNVRIRKIPSLFFKIKPHSILNEETLKEKFIKYIQRFDAVEINFATCLSPVKLFFETYHLKLNEVNYIYELIPKLEEENLIENCSSLFVDENSYQLPTYSQEQIEEEIKNVKNITSTILNKTNKK